MKNRRLRWFVHIVAVITLLLMATGGAWGFNFLQPYSGQIKFKYTNWEEEDPTGPGNKNGVIDQVGEKLRGIAKITTINAADLSNTLLWYDGKDGEELTIQFSGYTAQAITPVAGGYSIDFTGGVFNMYLGSPVNFNATYPGTGVTDGTESPSATRVFTRR